MNSSAFYFITKYLNEVKIRKRNQIFIFLNPDEQMEQPIVILKKFHLVHKCWIIATDTNTLIRETAEHPPKEWSSVPQRGSEMLKYPVYAGHGNIHSKKTVFKVSL